MFYHNINKELSSKNIFIDIQKALDKNLNIEVSNLNISLKAMVIADVFNKKRKNILAIVADDKLAENLIGNLDVLINPELISFIPDFETLPYEERSPHSTIRSLRIRALAQILLSDKPRIYVCSLRTMLRKIIPSSILLNNIKQLDIGSTYDPEILISELSGLGYQIEFQVEKVSQAAKRGGIIDIYSPNNSLPYRIEFFGDEVDTIRYFSPQNQRSVKMNVSNAIILPAREISLHDVKKDCTVQELINEEGFYQGIEQDISLLYSETNTIIDYFNKDSILFWDEFQYNDGDITELFLEASQLYSRVKKKNNTKILPLPSEVYEDYDFIKNIISKTNSVFLCRKKHEISAVDNYFSFNFKEIKNFRADFSKFEDDLHSYINKKFKIFIQSDNESQSSRMKELLSDVEQNISFTTGVFVKGFILPEEKIIVYTDHDIYNRYNQQKIRSRFSKKDSLADYESLKPGDYIVHIDHGVGVFEGLKRMSVDGNKIECLTINYAENDKIYVPTFQIQLVSKYVSEDGIEPRLNKIGSKKWNNQKTKAKKEIEIIAKDILNLYAERKMRKGIAHEPDTHWQKTMEDSFLYDETPDQLKVISEVKEDMESPISMERLLCGDVGFGKTEVAIRAAFKAVMSGYQVAILVPTTLLCEQHYSVFRERLAQYPIKLAMLSRFRTPKRIKQDIEDITNGYIDIVIGTHRVLSKDVVFKRLGLLIVDEEHRFGVRQKEKIRQLKSNVDTLYMSATPIPRTLSMALSKLKDISLIKTSPKERLPIRTIISKFNEDVIRDAIQREVDRGGQCFFLHNRVTTIKTIEYQLQSILPNVSFRVGHGKMTGKELENLLKDFYKHKFDVLISTTIIENGIDVPNANTIIVNDAHTFGLSQLYQIRGRVGRSNRRAYAYLLTPNKIEDEARIRLDALTEYDYLGAGYEIALKDLEIRGAGSILGTKQSGVINSVGFNYYNRLLHEAMENIENNKSNLFSEKENRENLDALKIRVDFYFPDSYIADEKERINLYRRLKEFSTPEEFNNLIIELNDRFGSIPDVALNAIQFFEIKTLSNQIGLQKCNVRNRKLELVFPEGIIPNKKHVMKLISLVKEKVSFKTANNFSILFNIGNEKNKSFIDVSIEILIKFLKIINDII